MSLAGSRLTRQSRAGDGEVVIMSATLVQIWQHLWLANRSSCIFFWFDVTTILHQMHSYVRVMIQKTIGIYIAIFSFTK